MLPGERQPMRVRLGKAADFEVKRETAQVKIDGPVLGVFLRLNIRMGVEEAQYLVVRVVIVVATSSTGKRFFHSTLC